MLQLLQSHKIHRDLVSFSKEEEKVGKVCFLWQRQGEPLTRNKCIATLFHLGRIGVGFVPQVIEAFLVGSFLCGCRVF